jgi:hypothetical protein
VNFSRTRDASPRVEREFAMPTFDVATNRPSDRQPMAPTNPTPIPVQTVLDYAPADRSAGRPPVPVVARVCGVVAGLIVPVICFATSFSALPIRPRWQSGAFEDYVLLMLSGWNAWPFFPLVAYSMVCMAVVCAMPRRPVAGRFWVRLGLYTGVLLAAQFCATLIAGALLPGLRGDSLAELALGVTCYVAAPVGGAVVLHVFFRLFRARWVWLGIAAAAGAGGLAVAIFSPGLEFFDAVRSAYLLVLVMGPMWCLEAYAALAIVSRRLRTSEDSPRARVLVPVWAGAYASSSATAVAAAIRTYQALPTTRPSGCYVATAAARGHGRFVRSREIAGVPVNDQLRRLKCAEIALAMLTPRVHRILRRFYDQVGPALAARMIHPLLADLAYMTLKPAEWVCVFALRRLLKEFDALAAVVYPETGDDASRRD